GQFPFDESKREDIVKWHLDPKHKLGKVNLPGVGEVLKKALAVNPAARFSSCKELLQALAQAGAVDRKYDEPLIEAEVIDGRPATTVEADLRAAGLIVGASLAGGLAIFVFAYLMIWAIDWVNSNGSWVLDFISWVVKTAAVCVFTGLLAATTAWVGRPKRP